MEAPPRCLPLFVRRTRYTPVQALHSARGGRSRALTFWLHQETRRLALRPASCVGCLLRVPTHTAQVTRPHTRAANPHSCRSRDHTLGHRPQERQGADPRIPPLEGTPYAAVLFNLEVGDELLEIVRRAVRLRAYAELNGEMSERGGVHWRVFGCSFYLTSSALNTSGHDCGRRRSLPRFRGSSACCVRALPGTRCPHESNMRETGTCHVLLLPSRLHQAAYARHAIDAGSPCSIDSVSSWPSLLRQTSFTVQRFPRNFFLIL